MSQGRDTLCGMIEEMRPDFRPLKPKGERILQMDIASHEVRMDDVRVKLSPMEYQILWLLNSRDGELVSEEELEKFLYAEKIDDLSYFSIAGRMTTLRDKLRAFEKNGVKLSITNQKGRGWRLEKS